MLRALFLTLLLPVFASGCDLACDRGGCNAVQHPIDGPKITAGIAGYIASESDAVTNGCASCPLSQATVKVWTAAAPIGTAAEAQTLVDGGPALHEIAVDERYEQALDPGDYLVCHEGGDGTLCAALTIAGGEVFTVNVKVGYGFADVVVFTPGASEARSGGLFEVTTVQ